MSAGTSGAGASGAGTSDAETALAMVDATAADAALLAEIHRQSNSPPWDAAAFARLLRQPGVAAIILRRDGAASGLAVTRAVMDEAELLTIGVVPAARRRGAGGALLHAALDRLWRAGVTRCHLEVAADNAAALALYQRRGFRPVGRRAGYYARPRGRVDAVTMVCEPSAEDKINN